MARGKAKGSAQSPEAERMQLAIAEIAAESWRYRLALKKALKKMDVMDAERFSRQYDYFADRVNQAITTADLRVLDLSGQPYSVGLPVQAINIEEFDEDEALVITQTIEPVIMMAGRVQRIGMVMVDRIHDTEE